MQTTAACPELTRYKKLASGELSSPEKEAVLDHLEKCQACVQRVESLSEKDTLVDLIRQARTLGEGPTGETVARLVERLRTLRPSDEAAPEALNLAPIGPGRDRRTAVTQSYHGAEPSEPASKALYDFLAPAQSPDELGRLGPYRVLKVLGAGGMGVVFQAEDPHLQRIVALKAMLPGLAASDSAKQRFLREARAAAALKHDHIVTIYQVAEHRGAPYLAMEFLEGEPLDDRLKREGKLSLADVLRIGREMAEGLAAAHERGLIHRDIKPANVWLEGRTGKVKILDFGLARAATDEAHLTQSGAILGTPGYIAPEQAQGKSVDPRCDLFSLGCVLYRMTTGTAPFRGTDIISTLMAVATDNPRPPHALEPSLPRALSDLILSLLAKEAGDRPASAQVVVEKLDHIAEELSRPAPVKPRKRWPAIAAAAAVLALLSAGAIFYMQTPDGTVRIEIDDPEIKLAIEGHTATITNADKQPITLKPGKHGLTITRGDFIFNTASFEMPKRGKTVLAITWHPGQKMVVAQDSSIIGEKAVPLVTADPDRRAAEYVLSLGGKVTIAMEASEREITAAKDLPAGSFQIIGIDTLANQKMNDDGLAQFKPLKRLTQLRLSYARISNSGLKNLQSLTQLKELYLQGASIDDRGLDQLTPLVELRKVNLGDLPLSNSGLARLKNLTNLTHLWMYQVPIDDDGLVHLKALVNLDTLMLSGTKVRGPGLEYLRDLPSLRTLYISYIPLGEAAIQRLAKLQQLEALEVRQSNVDDDALKHIQAMPRLRSLDLDGTPVTDAGLEHLKATKLQQIVLTNTKVTASGLAKVQKALPSCKIIRDGGIIPEAVLASIGGGDPKRAPAELVAVLGDGRFRITDSFFPAFSPDGSLLAVPSGGEVCLFNANSGHLLRRFRGRSGRVCAVAFSPNGAMLAMGDVELVRLWDPRSGVLLRDLAGHAPGLMSGVAFTADSQTVLSGSSDKTVRVWDVTTGGQRRVLSCPSEVRSIAVTPDGHLAVAGTGDGHVHGWSLDTGAEKFVLEVAKQLQTWVSVSANGQWLAGGTGNKLKVWKIADLATKDPTPFFEKQTPAECLFFEKNSNKLWTAKHNGPTPDNNRAWCWDPASGQLVSSFALRSTGAPWMHVAISPDGRTAAALGHNDRVVQLYDTRTGKPRFPDPGHTREVDSVAFSPDGHWLASGSRDHTIRVWDLATGTPRHTLTGHTGPVGSVAFSPDGKLLASGSEDRTIALWDPVTGARVHKLDGHCRDSSVRFSPDGKLVAAGTADGGVRLWFTRNGEEARVLPHLHEGLVRCLAFSADGRRLATGGEDGKLVITELASGKVLQSFKRDSAVFTVEFGADGETVAAGYVPPEPVVRVWNLKDKDFVKLDGHRDRVNTVSLRSDGRLVVTTSLDGSVRLWEIGGNPPRQMVLGLGSVSGSLSPDGRYVATGNSNGTISLFRLPGPAEDIGEWLAARGSPPPGLSEEAWLKRVKGLYFGRVPDAVADRLRELNPGFDGKVEYEFDGNDVVKLSFLTPTIKDISPLRALPGLRSLACGGAFPVFGQIADLTPLEGMKLTSLYLRDTYVSDLSPLKGMPLTNLVCTGTKVSDLSPLKGMPLKTLHIDTTQVVDLSPLKDMKLEILGCYNTPVTDLSPLKDMKLRFLDCNATQVTGAGLAPLQEMSSLRDLRIGGGKMTEDGLAHLKKLTDLETLAFFDNRLTEAGLRNLKGMTKLQVLILQDTGLMDADLVHLKGFLGLRVLNLARTRVTDAGLEHLTGLKNLVELNLLGLAVTGKGVAKLKAALLQILILENTGFTDEDLVQLKGFLSLRVLSLTQTRVTDAGLEHLAGLKNLVELYLNGTAVTDKGVAKLKAALPQCKIIR